MVSRRELIATVAGGAVAAMAGCLSDAAGNEPADDEPFIIVTNGSTEIAAVTSGQVDSVGEITEDTPQLDGPAVPITLIADGTASLRDAIGEVDGFSSPENIELRLTVDGEVINSLGLSPGLAESIDAGEWNGEFVAVTDSRGDAEMLRDALQG